MHSAATSSSRSLNKRGGEAGLATIRGVARIGGKVICASGKVIGAMGKVTSGAGKVVRIVGEEIEKMGEDGASTRKNVRMYKQQVKKSIVENDNAK